MRKNNNNIKNKFKGDVINLSFAQKITPLPNQKPKGNRKGNDIMMLYGDNNLYPNFLLELYNDSPIHKGIVNSKLDYILGKDVIYADSQEKAEFKVNNEEKIGDLLNKVVKDFVIFNYYAVEVIYNGVGEAIEWNHIPANLLRTNKAKNKFWYCEDWYSNSNSTIEFNAWENRIKDENYASKIFFYSAYTPSVNGTYPIPDYSGAIKSIETDIAIRDFHSNNITNSFSPSSIITFFNGEPTEEIKSEIENGITNSYTGVNGKKILINFANEDSKASEVTNISPSDWNDSFLTLKDNTVADIIQAHSLTSPLLAGVSVAGQLGGNTELETAYQIFKNLYVLNKRNEIIKSINNLFYGIFQEIEIEDNGELFKKELDSSILQKIMTIDELREVQGLKPLNNNTGNRLIDDIPNVTAPALAPANFSKEKEKEAKEEDNRFELIQDFGLAKEDYIILNKEEFNKKMRFAHNNKLTTYLIDNSPFAGLNLKDIQDNLDDEFTIQEIKKEIAKLVVTKIIDVTELIEDVDIKEAKKEVEEVEKDDLNINKIQILYSYDGVIDHLNRPFCSKLVQTNKFYSREDIQKMSEVLGFDIFIHKGGKNCRHRWTAHQVIKK